METYLIYGPPGSGKTTISKAVCEKLGIDYISLGDITRREIGADTPLGREMKFYLDQPIEYPVEFIQRIIETELESLIQSANGAIMDGYPKYDWEVEKFLEYLRSKQIAITTVILVNLSLEAALVRIEHRYVCEECRHQQASDTLDVCEECGGKVVRRDDDEIAVFKRRYGDHAVSIDATLTALKNNYGKLISVDADKPQDEVIADILSQLES